MDALILSRLQFAITTVYHFLFVPVTLGLSIFVALLETWYVNSGSYEERIKLKKLVKFFGTIFLINFAMGVVTGIVQEFHFGMNWSEYARFMGDIFGAPLALEALTAFFIESTFIGLWIFGWDKLSEKLHCLCIWIVAFGSNLSAFWILVANSFMQHPVGYAIEDGRAVMTDFIELVTNPYVVGEYSHALFAGITTGGFLVIVVSAWKIGNVYANSPPRSPLHNAWNFGRNGFGAYARAISRHRQPDETCVVRGVMGNGKSRAVRGRRRHQSRNAPQ